MLRFYVHLFKNLILEIGNKVLIKGAVFLHMAYSGSVMDLNPLQGVYF